MNRFTSAGLIPFFTTTLFAANACAAGLVVTVKPVTKAQGKVMVAIYNSESGFQKTMALGAVKPATTGEMTFNFPDLSTGNYAVMVYQDLNGNEKLDSNMFGIPKEPWGASLQGKTVFGAPAWKDTRFELPDKGLSLSIDLN
ncbi:MAG: DUF2141 domain-containing protein [Burkholderiaceae bacterium]